MSIADRDGLLWYDGKMVAWRSATTHVLSHTLHYGMGVFEGVRAYATQKGPAIFRLAEHVDRLFCSAHIMGIPLPFTQETIAQAHYDLVKVNQLQSCYFRPMAFYGAGAMGMAPSAENVHIIVAAWPWDNYLGEKAAEQGIRTKTSSFSRHHVNVTMCKAKANGNYINSSLASAEATQAGYDEALLLDVEGYVAEGPSANIFIVRRGKLITPELTSALEGITRDTIITLAQELGVEILEKRITRDEVYSADEAFFTGTAVEIVPIRELDNRQIGAGTRGIITTKLQKYYFDCVRGLNSKYTHWLSYMN